MPGADGHQGGKAFYMDTEGTFRPDRLRYKSNFSQLIYFVNFQTNRWSIQLERESSA